MLTLLHRYLQAMHMQAHGMQPGPVPSQGFPPSSPHHFMYYTRFLFILQHLTPFSCLLAACRTRQLASCPRRFSLRSLNTHLPFILHVTPYATLCMSLFCSNTSHRSPATQRFNRRYIDDQGRMLQVASAWFAPARRAFAPSFPFAAGALGVDVAA